MNKRAYGIDISHYQKSYVPQVHHDFVTVKCTDGTVLNSSYNQLIEIVLDSGKLAGAYHYFRSSVHWKHQVEAFLSASQNAHFLALDFEKKGNTASIAFALNASSFIDGLTGANKRVLFYSSPSVIQEWMYQLGVYWVRKYDDLWIAQWPFKAWDERLKEVLIPEMGWSPRLPAGTTKWRVWQYSADGNRRGSVEGVGSRDIDLDVYNGSVDDMKRWIGFNIFPPEEPEVTNKDLAEAIIGLAKQIE